MRPRRPNKSRPSSRRRRKKFFTEKPGKIYFDGVIVETLPGVKFKAKIDRGEKLDPLVLPVDLRKLLIVKRVKIIKGDRVKIEVDPTDLSHGTIVERKRD